MNCYCGTDIIEVDRIKDAIKSTKGFKERIFTTNEIDFAEQKKDLAKYQHYAGRFAAKEAVYKALSNINSDLNLSDIEILNDVDNKNRPVVNIHLDYFQKLIDGNKLKIDVSISHIKDYAQALAIANVL